MSKLNILFMGTPDFAAESLEKLCSEGFNICGVVTNPDRPKNRGMKVEETEVKKVAIKRGLKILQPEKVKGNTEFCKLIEDMKPNIICVIAYGKILPKEILDIPEFGCINVHASLLPKYRGAAPIQWAVLNGDKVTGVSTMYMNEKMDEGDIIFQEQTEIGEYETTGELWDRLKVQGANLLIKTINEIEMGTAPRVMQGDNFTVAPMLNKEISKIDFSKSAVEIKNKVCGLNPIMGAYALLNGKKIKFWRVQILENEVANEILKTNVTEENVPGEVAFANDKIGLYIKVKCGVLKIIELQGENSKKMNSCDFLRGTKILAGEIFC